jgi:hypothetical protein
LSNVEAGLTPEQDPKQTVPSPQVKNPWGWVESMPEEYLIKTSGKR